MNPCRRPAKCTDSDFGPEDCTLCNPVSCDVCDRIVALSMIATVIAYGIETGACDVCRGVKDAEQES